MDQKPGAGHIHTMPKVYFGMPKKKDLHEVVHYFIGLSNSMALPYNTTDYETVKEHRKSSKKSEAEIRRILGVKELS